MKNLKKLLVLLLCVILTVPTFTAMAASKLFNSLSSTIHTFSDVDLQNYNMEDFIGATINNNDTNNSFEISEIDGVKALHTYCAKDGTASKNVNAATYYDTNNYFTKLSLDFKIKRAGDIKNDFGVYLRDYSVTPSSNQQVEVFQLRNEGKIRFLGSDVCTYQKDTWYDIEMLMDFDTKFGKIGVKKDGESSFTYYEVPFKLLPQAGTDNLALTFSKSAKICFMFTGSTTTTQHSYITNLKQNIFTNPLDRKMSEYTQDFEGSTLLKDHTMSIAQSHKYGDTLVTTNALADSKSNFLLENGAGDTNTSYSIETINGNNVLALNKQTGSTKAYQCVQKYLNSTLYKTSPYHLFSFKIGGTKDGNNKQILLRRQGSSALENSVKLQNGKLYIYDKTKASWVEVENLGNDFDPTYLYQCYFYYNSQNHYLTYGVTTKDGENHFRTITLDSDFERFIIQNNGGAQSNLYIDDFMWTILPEKSYDALVSVKSGEVADASIDETLVFDYTEPISDTCLNEVAITTIKNGELVTTPYTLEVKGGKLLVKFSKLDESSYYEVKVEGAKTSLLKEVDEAFIAFTTTSSVISATTPVCDDLVVKTKVSTGYSEGKDGVLIVCLYNEDNVREKIILNPFTAKRNEENIVTIDISGETFTKAEAFVWSDFMGMQAYSKNSVFIFE